MFGDTETWCEEPIQNGTPKYAETAELMVFTWTFDDEESVRCWDRTVDLIPPQELLDAVNDPKCIWVFHNAFFDRTMLQLQHPELCPPIERWRCSMVKGMAHSLPGALEKQGEIMGLAEDQKKLKEGKDLVRLFCCPQPKTYKLRRATRLTHPEKWARFLDYAKGDITSMRAIWKKLPSWNYGPKEIALWHLDQRVNSKGVYIDLDFVNAAVKASDAVKKGLAEETQEQTGFDAETGEGLESTTKRDKMLKYLLAEYGVDLPDLRASTIERRVNDESLPQSLRNLLAIRLEASQTSVTKYKKILRTISKDGRLRGLLQFDAAFRTRRWGGRNFQPQNLVRPPKYVAKAWEQTIAIIKQDAVDLFYSKPMEVLGGTIRGVIAAPPGKKLVVPDLSNIEGRMGAWLGGEAWKLQAFRDYDTVKGADGSWYPTEEYYAAALRGEIIELELDAKGDPIRKGPDLYKVSYANAFRIGVADVDEYMRQIGKIMELMLQYGGGCGAFVTGALTYGIDLENLADIAYPTIPKRTITEAEKFLKWLYEKAEKKHLKRLEKHIGTPEDLAVLKAESLAQLAAEKLKARLSLPEKVFIVCDSLKRLWREAHNGITPYWKQLEKSAIKAIAYPGTTVKCGKVNFVKEKAWLKILLPSGRCLCYPNATIDEDGGIKYKGVNQYSRKWSWIKTYGGKFLENIAQSLSRDVMADNMPKIEKAGYEIVLTVHDEVVTEAPLDDRFNPIHLSALLAQNHDWCKDLPLAAAGWEGPRYRKG